VARRLWIPVAAPVALFANALAGRRLLADGDAYHHYLPLHLLAARAVRAGHLPVWNPWAFSGYPLLAAGQVAAFYPPNWIFLGVGPVLANNLIVVFDFVVVAAGATLLARRLTGDPGAAVVGGFAFGLCGFFFSHMQHQSILAAVSWLPWTLLGFELLRERFTPLRFLLTSVSLGLELIAGHSQMFFMAIAMLMLYAIVLAASDAAGARARARPVALAIAIVAAGAGVSAIQLVPTAAVLHATDRSNLPYAEAVTYSFPSSHTALMAFPYLFGDEGAPSGPFDRHYRGKWNLTELGVYPGLAALALAAAGLATAKRDRRVIALLVVAAAGTIAAMGDSTPFGHLIYDLPVYGQFRSWARYALGLDLAIAMLAAYGVALLRRPPDRHARRGALQRAGAVAGLAVVAALVLPHLHALHPYLVKGRARALALVLPCSAAALAAGCCLLFGRFPRAATAAAAVVVTADALAFGWFSTWRTKSPSIARMKREYSATSTPVDGPVIDAPGGIDRRLFVGINPGAPAQYVDETDVADIRSVNGFDPLAPRDYLRSVGGMAYFGSLTRPADVWRPGSHLLDVLRVTTIVEDPLTTSPRPPATGTLLGPPRVARGMTHPVNRYDYTPKLPDMLVVGAVEARPRPSIIAGLNGTSIKPWDPATSALVDAGARCDGCPAGPPGRAGTVSDEQWATASITADVVAARPGLLVVSQSMFPGWRVRVDGRDGKVVRANATFLAVGVPAGTHHVVFSYRAPGLVPGAIGTAVTLVALGGWVALDRRRRAGRPARAW